MIELETVHFYQNVSWLQNYYFSKKIQVIDYFGCLRPDYGLSSVLLLHFFSFK